MNPSHPLVRLLPLSTLTLILGTGCSAVRENVISSVNTGFGVHVTQNPQTQVPEIKVGYLRSQFYSIPTAKTVGQLRNNNGQKVTKTHAGTEVTETGTQSTDPSNTPELVSGIRAGASAKSGIVGMDISENFAVGKIAVNSPAAIAMYISQAENASSAKAASTAVVAQQVETQKTMLKEAAKTEANLRSRIDGMDSTTLINSGRAAKDAELFEDSDLTAFNGLDDTGKKEKLKRAVVADSREDLQKVKHFEQLLK